jgi:hypothetical protein
LIRSYPQKPVNVTHPQRYELVGQNGRPIQKIESERLAIAPGAKLESKLKRAITPFPSPTDEKRPHKHLSGAAKQILPQSYRVQ